MEDSEDFSVEDNEGAEIDEDSYPILLQLQEIPNIVFKRQGEVDFEIRSFELSHLSNGKQSK